MPTTPRLALAYPSPNDAPDVPYRMQLLAESVETALMIKAGRNTDTTDAAGNISWPHGLGVAPRAALLTATTANGTHIVQHYTTGTNTTTLAAVVRNPDGAAPPTGTSVTVNWLVVG